MNKKIAITTGDFNGIGPEIIAKALKNLDLPVENYVVVGSKTLFEGENALDDSAQFVEIPFKKEWLKIGQETKEAGEFSYQCLIKACEMAKNGVVDSIVTAPVSKNALHLSGHNFSGQTEVLEKELKGAFPDVTEDNAEMLFAAGDFRVLLLTRHVALKDVKITKELLVEKLERLERVLQETFGVEKSRIALCSLNPHGGENGILGREEIDEFLPALEILKSKGIDATSPLSADTLFVKASKAYLSGSNQPYDCYVACYHDQGLIPMKVLAMDSTVNMTVGLGVLRTSPAHGTAYDIAGKNLADESSMVEAIKQALGG